MLFFRFEVIIVSWTDHNVFIFELKISLYVSDVAQGRIKTSKWGPGLKILFLNITTRVMQLPLLCSVEFILESE